MSHTLTAPLAPPPPLPSRRPTSSPTATRQPGSSAKHSGVPDSPSVTTCRKLYAASHTPTLPSRLALTKQPLGSASSAHTPFVCPHSSVRFGACRVMPMRT